MANNQTYWRERFIELENRMHQLAREKSGEYVRYLKKAYTDAADGIEKEIRAFYQQFQQKNGLTKQQANKLLSYRERMKFQMTLEDFIAQGKKIGLPADWIGRLENASQIYHISRLEALGFQIRQQIEMLHTGVATETSGVLGTLYQEGYLRTAYALQMGTGVGAAFAQLNQRQIDRALARPWAKDGLNFSERIWGKYRPRLTYELETTLAQGIIRGRSPDKIIRTMAENLGVAREQTATLVMTESAFIASSAQLDCMSELAVEQYEILSALDGSTCTVCGGLDKKVYKLSEYLVGDTAPPFHANCRCTTAPYFHNEFTQGEMRAARGEDGKTEYIPADMTYEQWKQSFVTESDSLIGKARRNFKGAVSGRELIPFEGLPETVQNRFRNGLQNADSMVRTVIERELQDLDFFVTDGKNVFNSRLNAIGIKPDASPSTIAHEIFHRMDKVNGITKRYDFGKALKEDFERLQFLSKGNISEYLTRQYPKAFASERFAGKPKVMKEYRGVSDILSGLTNDKLSLGYRHTEEYWKKSVNRLPKEAWAQFGRMKFENNPEVLDMFEWLFPNFNDYATMALKELI